MHLKTLKSERGGHFNEKSITFGVVFGSFDL